jgi:hypothetical protein
MKKALLSTLVIFLVGFISAESMAQEEKGQYNDMSVYPISYADQMYKRTVWRRMDLKEKQNRPFFSTSNEITRIILEAVNNGLIYPYVDDSLNKRMSKEQFLENLKLPTDEEDGFGAAGAGFGDDAGGWGDSGWGDEEAAAPSVQYYDATQLNIMRIREDMIFDNVRVPDCTGTFNHLNSLFLLLWLPQELRNRSEYSPIRIWKSFSEVCPTGPYGIIGRIMPSTGIWLMHSFSGFSMPGL